MKPVRVVSVFLFAVLCALLVWHYRPSLLRSLPQSTAAARATRQSRITVVAPAPLPKGLPLLGAEGAFPDGYPTQYVDQAGLRSLLWHGELATLDRDFDELQRRFEGDPRFEFWPSDAASAFDSPEPELDPALDAWVKASSGSFAPYLARGVHRVAVAYARRGAKYAKDTPAEDMTAMESGLAGAMEDLDRARTLRPKLVAAMRVELQLLLLAPTHHDLSKVMDDAAAVCPSCFLVRVTYILGLRPRWGGSYEQMAAFARASADARWPRLAALAGYADDDRADLVYREKKYDEALALAAKAFATGETANFLLDRALIHRAKKDYASARVDLDRALTLRPTFEEAGFDSASLHAAERQWEPAGRDLLTWLRIDPTNATGRQTIDTVVAGLVYDGWESFKGGKRDDALRLYDLASDLAPLDDDVHRRRAWVILGHEGATVDETIAMSEAALKEHPDDFRAVQELDYALSRKRAFDRILPLWDAYLVAHPDDGQAHMERAGTLHNLRRETEARAEALKACTLGVSEGCARTGR